MMVSEVASATPFRLERPGAPGERTDAELMERVRGGEVEAFAPLVKRYERRLFGFVLSQLGEPDTAADLAQETFVRAFRAASRYRESGRFESWLFRIAGNLVRSELRRRMRRGIPASVDSEAVREIVRDDAVPPDEEAFHGELRLALREALPRLPQAFREAVMLRYVEGWSYREIAGRLGIEVGTAKSRAHRGLQRLRLLLGPRFEGALP